MGDEELHKVYMYLRYVEKLLPKNKIDVIDLEGTVKLTYYNLKQTFDGSVSLRKTEETQGVIKPQGAKVQIAVLPEKRLLNEVIQKVNELYSGQFTDGDNLIVENLMNTIMEDKTIKNLAKNNNKDMFTKSVFPKVFSEKTAKCYKESATSYKKLFENKEFYDAIMNSLGNVIYRLMKNEYDEENEKKDNNLKVAEDSEEYKLEE